jgi:hypothetical protein
VKRLLRLALLVALVVWAWRRIRGPSGPLERAGVSYSDGSSIVLEPGSAGFEQLASIARRVIGP